MNDYRTMWLDLGMNLELHDQLLENLSELHESIHLAQQNRPKQWKDLIAHFMPVMPNGWQRFGTIEKMVASRLVHFAFMSLMKSRWLLMCFHSIMWRFRLSVNYADKMFPRDICPMVRSTFGMAFSGT